MNAKSTPGIVAPNVRDLTELSLTLAQWLETRLPNASSIAISNLSYP